MTWLTRIKAMFQPGELQQLDSGQLALALNNPSVRTHWLESVLEELQRLNLSVDKLLEKREFDKLPEIAARRAQTVAILQQIEASKTNVEMESNHNQADPYEHLAVQPAPGD